MGKGQATEEGWNQITNGLECLDKRLGLNL